VFRSVPATDGQIASVEATECVWATQEWPKSKERLDSEASRKRWIGFAVQGRFA